MENSSLVTPRPTLAPAFGTKVKPAPEDGHDQNPGQRLPLLLTCRTQALLGPHGPRVVTTAIITDTEHATERTGNQPGGETQAAGTLVPTTEVGRVLQHATAPYFSEMLPCDLFMFPW